MWPSAMLQRPTAHWDSGRGASHLIHGPGLLFFWLALPTFRLGSHGILSISVGDHLRKSPELPEARWA